MNFDENKGNSFVSYNLKLIRIIDKLLTLTQDDYVNNVQYVQNIRNDYYHLTSFMGIEVDVNDKKGLKTLRADAKQTLENIMDNIPHDLSARQVMELLIASASLDLPDYNTYAKSKATGDFGLTYVMQNANCIINYVHSDDLRNKLFDEFNYLDLVDGDYLEKDDTDAMYFHSTGKLATVGDIYKEYRHAITFLQHYINEAVLFTTF